MKSLLRYILPILISSAGYAQDIYFNVVDRGVITYGYDQIILPSGKAIILTSTASSNNQSTHYQLNGNEDLYWAGIEDLPPEADLTHQVFKAENIIVFAQERELEFLDHHEDHLHFKKIILNTESEDIFPVSYTHLTLPTICSV